MMNRFGSFFLGIIVGAALCYGASNFHVVRAQDGFHLVQKVRAGLADAYVDVRTFAVSDWSARPDLVAALVRENKQYIMTGNAAEAIQQQVKQLVPPWPKQ